jgi:hypothetical protein
MGLYRMTLTSWLVLLDLRPFYAKLSFIHKLMFLVSGPRLNHLPFLPLISPCTPKLLLYFQPNSKGISVSARLLPPIGDDCVCWCSPAPGGALVRPVLGMVQRPCRAWFDIPGVTPKAPPEVQPRPRRKRQAKRGNCRCPRVPGDQRGLQWRPRQGQQPSWSRLLRSQHVASPG